MGQFAVLSSRSSVRILGPSENLLRMSDPFVHTSVNESVSATATHSLMLGLVSLLELHLVRLEHYTKKTHLLWTPTEASMLKEEQELEQACSKLREMIGQQQGLARRWASLIADCGESQPLSCALDPANYRMDDWPPWADQEEDDDEETEDDDDEDFAEPEHVDG